MKILRTMVESIYINNNPEEADQEINNGEEMIDGIEDHLPMKKEALLPTVIMKILKNTSLNAQGMQSNFWIYLRLLKRIKQKIQEKNKPEVEMKEMEAEEVI